MFCPNCGQNCGEARFCSNCGTKLFQEPYTQHSTKWDSYTIPEGKCRGYGGYIKLEEHSFLICNRFAFGREIRIPYDQLTNVLYVRPEKKLTSNGYLIVRWTGNRDKPISTGYARRNEKSAVVFGFLQDMIFYHIYCLLKTLAPHTAICEMETPKSNMPEVDKGANDEELNIYFHAFNPDRAQAVGAFMRDLGMNMPAATAIIDRAFDMRQQALYEAEPSAAVRDLNRVIMKNTYTNHTYHETK